MPFFRVIPSLLLDEGRLVKTVRFAKPSYVGDPINAVRIFNDKEVDEIVMLDIRATRAGRGPDIHRVTEIVGEAFVPFAYGGGLTTVEQVRAVMFAGVEKVVFGAALYSHPETVREASRRYGAQAIVASVDVKATRLSGQRVVTHGATRKTRLRPEEAARRAVELGAGEILLNSVDRDGTFAGYDLDLVERVAAAVEVPVVALGGARGVEDFAEARLRGAGAAAAGAAFVYQRPHRAVLISFPPRAVLRAQVYAAD